MSESWRLPMNQVNPTRVISRPVGFAGRLDQMASPP